MMPGRERTEADKGGKVFLPASALRTLTRLNIQYPMLFSLSSDKSGRKTHCGVLEFVAGETIVCMGDIHVQRVKGMCAGNVEFVVICGPGRTRAQTRCFDD